CVMCPRRCTKLRMCDANPPPDDGAGAATAALSASGSTPSAAAASEGFLFLLSRSASLMSAASYGHDDFNLVVGGQDGLCVSAARDDGAIAFQRHALACIAERLDKLGNGA